MRGARGDEAGIRRGREIQADVKEFIASDHVYGSQIKDLTESRKFALNRALADAAHLGGVASKYSKSLHGAVLGLEVAEHCMKKALFRKLMERFGVHIMNVVAAQEEKYIYIFLDTLAMASGYQEKYAEVR